MTASLAILPSAPNHGQPIPPLSPRRPKLTLNTSQVPQIRTYGKGSTSLRLDTLSAVSPTARNTFSNAYQPLGKPQLSVDSAVPPAKSSDSATTPSSDANTPSSASTLGSASTSSSTSSASSAVKVPYKLPHNLPSILSNSPLPSIRHRRMSTSTSRPLFPAPKRVSFRAPLEEEIKTVKYTMAHSDIDSSASSSTISISTSSSSEQSASITISESPSGSSSTSSHPLLLSSPSSSEASSLEQSNSPSSSSDEGHHLRSPRTGEKRDSSDSDSDSCPETPVAGRRKRRREWVWTLGPIRKDGSFSADYSSDDDSS